jgi:hypothetical protein
VEAVGFQPFTAISWAWKNEDGNGLTISCWLKEVTTSVELGCANCVIATVMQKKATERLGRHPSFKFTVLCVLMPAHMPTAEPELSKDLKTETQSVRRKNFQLARMIATLSRSTRLMNSSALKCRYQHDSIIDASKKHENKVQCSTESENRPSSMQIRCVKE